MKTKHLIEQLQKLDPTGEKHCVVGNIDIYFLTSECGYYDGYGQKLIRDPSKAPYYDIVGAEYSAEDKIQIHTYSIEDYITDNPDGTVKTLSSCQEVSVQRWRDEIKEIYSRIAAEESKQK